ncbi:MAG TPA: hypothetical protein VGR02_02080 [Thermoanaerobaculia bacterium]|jgi:hypothetical protein|nr:hypothetical protein [Thermoanaerobaculia bacterium]
MRYFVKKEAQFGAQKRCAVPRAARAPRRRAMCSIVVSKARASRDARRLARIVRSAAHTHRQMRIFRM